MVRSDILRALAMIATVGLFMLTLAAINRHTEPLAGPLPPPSEATPSLSAGASVVPSSRAPGLAEAVREGGAR